MEKFKKGDRVFSYSYQRWGTVVAISTETMYPVEVDFDNKHLNTYTEDGRSITRYGSQDIFFDEVSIVAPKRPLPKLVLDTKVIVSDEDIFPRNIRRYFSHFGECGDIHCFRNGSTSWTNDNNETVRWSYWGLAED